MGVETDHYTCYVHGPTVIALLEKKRGDKMGGHYYRLPFLKDNRM